MSQPTPDFLLERLRLGELDPVAEARLRARLTADDQARIAAMQADDAALIAAHPPRVVAVEVQRRLQRQRRPSRLWIAVPALAMAAAVGFFALRPAPVDRIASLTAPSDVTRAKGDDRLLIFRRTGDGGELLDDGSTARPGDELQLALALSAARHAVVMSVDGRGAITVHFPVDHAPAAALDAGRHPLDHAFALDDAPRFERFVLVTAEAPIDPDAVREALTAAGADEPLALPDDWHQTAVTIRKEQR